MKQKKIVSNTPHLETKLMKALDSQELDKELGDSHFSASWETPLRSDAFDLSPEEKVKKIALHFREIMETLGLDLTDDSLSGTPLRVAKMYVNEVFAGLLPENKPSARLFENQFKYGEMLVEKDITIHSYCEHHFVPIIGKAHVAYFSSGKVIGLSKINRICQYYSKRPQVQERLTQQIGNELLAALNTEDVAVVLDAHHFCVSTRGVEDVHSNTTTSFYSGKFKDELVKKEFLSYLQLKCS